MKKIVTCCLVTLAVSGCATNPSSSCQSSGMSKVAVGTGVGAVAGTAVGAGIGAIAGDAGKGAWIGAASGAVIGAGVGYYLQAQEDELRAALKGSGVDVAQQGCDLAVIMPGNVAFTSGSANINTPFYPTLNSVATVLKKSPDSGMTIAGHTDSVGSSAANTQLSKNRANSVAQYLAKQGVSAQRINTLGLGDTAPVASNSDNQGRAKNRRVVILIHPPQQ